MFDFNFLPDILENLLEENALSLSVELSNGPMTCFDHQRSWHMSLLKPIQ